MRRRLDHVDAMRPIKQAGVLTTHATIYFAPATAAVSSGAALLLLHVSREGFFFISSCMLAYAYPNLKLTSFAEVRHYYWRRFLAVGVPYLCWNLIYYLYTMPTSHYSGTSQALSGLGKILETGYFQLYFLFVIFQFYLVFPLLIMFLRKTKGHHGLVLGAALLAQLAVSCLSQWNELPWLMQKYNQEDALSYLIYLVGGCIVAFHFEQVDAWLRRHAWLVVTLTVAAALAAECCYFLDRYADVGNALTSGDSAFLPTLIPFNVGVIACGYLGGIALVRPNRSRISQTALHTCVDDSYGVYLSHMLVLDALAWLHWGNLAAVIPWPVLCLLTVTIVIACCVPLTELLARTPLAVPLTGRKRVPRHRPYPAQPDHPAVESPAAA